MASLLNWTEGLIVPRQVGEQEWNKTNGLSEFRCSATDNARFTSLIHDGKGEIWASFFNDQRGCI